MSSQKSKTKPNHKKVPRIKNKLGKAPGTVTYQGNRAGTISSMSCIMYSEDMYREKVISQPENIMSNQDDGVTEWINVIGISDEAYIGNLGRILKLNPLVTEDIVNTFQRPKIDEYDDYIFAVFTMLYLEDDQRLVSEHVALVLFENAVVVFQELEQDVFNGIRQRIKNKTGRVRSKKADYLFFILMDAIIDNYYVILEHISDRIEALETEVYESPGPETARKIQQLKKDVLGLRRFIVPVRELVIKLLDSGHKLILPETKFFLRDALDHTTEMNENLQIYREMAMSLMEMYMSNVSNKMNEVMKVLTIMASIFIPLTFIAGIYGMNFDHMPELHWKDGYFIILGFMLLIFIAMILFFKKKRWL